VVLVSGEGGVEEECGEGIEWEAGTARATGGEGWRGGDGGDPVTRQRAAVGSL
jgi:hypothetical protein